MLKTRLFVVLRVKCVFSLWTSAQWPCSLRTPCTFSTPGSCLPVASAPVGAWLCSGVRCPAGLCGVSHAGLLHPCCGASTLFSPLSTLHLCCWPVSPTRRVACRDWQAEPVCWLLCPWGLLRPSPEQVLHGLSVSSEVLGGPVGPHTCWGPGVLANCCCVMSHLCSQFLKAASAA